MTVKEAQKILSLPDNYTIEELKRQYRIMMKKWHPDICKAENANEMVLKVGESYRLLQQQCGVCSVKTATKVVVYNYTHGKNVFEILTE